MCRIQVWWSYPHFSSAERLVHVQVISLVELDSMQNAVVGRPGEDGLSVEQRKRLTIAVELVANPSIVFMDEPTSGERFHCFTVCGPPLGLLKKLQVLLSLLPVHCSSRASVLMDKPTSGENWLPTAPLCSWTSPHQV